MSRSLTLVVVTALVTGVVAGVVSVVGLARSTPSVAGATPAVRAVPVAAAAPGAVAVLRVWDARRAAAWARGDPAALTALYVPGSPAGRRDGAMLEAWASRGLRVTGLRTQLLAVAELGRTAQRWRLRVTDRVVGGVAVGHGVRRSLPADRASTRTIVLQRAGEEWLVASVTAAVPP